MRGSSSLGVFKRALPLLILLVLCSAVFLGAKSRDAEPPKDKSKPWYRGKENLEKYFLVKKDLPKAPLLDYSQDCMLCHNAYYDQWWRSGHSQSYNNPFFQDAWQHYREWWDYETDRRKTFDKMGKYDGKIKGGMDEQPEWGLELTKTDCLSCHAPSINATIKYTDDLELKNVLLAMREGYIPRFEDVASGRIDKDLRYDYGVRWADEQIEEPSLDIALRKQVRYIQRISDFTKDGISCDFCHTITRLSHVNERQSELHRMHNMNYSLNFEHRFGMKKWGSIEESPTASHTIQYSPIYTQSEFCASCHQETNDFGLMVQDTYNEWKFSDWARAGISCQSCHMPEYRGVASKHGQIRDNAHDHSFLGAEDPAFLMTAADMTVDATRTDDYVDLSVRIINNGTGHSLPTGLPFRRVVLVVRAMDDLGQVFWDARQLDVDDGFVRSLPDGYWTGRGDYPAFQRLLGSSYPTFFEDSEEVPYWMADRVISDNRIRANETRELMFRIPTADQPGAVFITAQLFFRKASPKYGTYFDLVDRPLEIAGMGYTVN